MSGAALVVDGASVTLGGKKIIDDVSLALRAGEVTVVLGPNGAGKSTLAAVASGLRRPDAGTVTLGGEAVVALSAKQLARRRAVLPQASATAFAFTVREVVSMGRIAFDGAAARTEELTDEALALTDLHGLAHRTVTTLSGGERQRVNLARVLAQLLPVEPGKVLLLDEPTAAMDIRHAEHTLRLARQLAADGAAVGMVLHDLDAAASHADRVLVLAQGTERAAGPAGAVLTSELLSEVYATPIDVVEVDGRPRVLPRR